MGYQKYLSPPGPGFSNSVKMGLGLAEKMLKKVSRSENVLVREPAQLNLNKVPLLDRLGCVSTTTEEI